MADLITTLAARALESRQVRCYRTTFGRTRCQNTSRFGNWGRWVLLAVVLVVALIAFFLFACICARRRRKAYRKPIVGTGWAVPRSMKHVESQDQNYQAPPPQYGQTTSAPSGNYGANAGYSGNTANTDYAPPPGPPPGAHVK